MVVAHHWSSTLHLHQLPRWCLKTRRQRGQQPVGPRIYREAWRCGREPQEWGGEGAEGVKFEYVFGGVMPSPAGVNASRSKNFDHVGEAEICCVRRGRSQCLNVRSHWLKECRLMEGTPPDTFATNKKASGEYVPLSL